VKVHSLLHGSRANGPGVRSVVWVQGCAVSPHCPGCHNPLTHPFDAGREIQVADLADEIIRNAAPGTAGLTISGGEPMNQAVSVFALIDNIRQKAPSWTVGMFTGYTLDELMNGLFDLREPGILKGRESLQALWIYCLKPQLDFLVSGRYDRSQPAKEPLISSANQRLSIYTNRYTYDDFSGPLVEFGIGPEGLTTITGFPG